MNRFHTRVRNRSALVPQGNGMEGNGMEEERSALTLVCGFYVVPSQNQVTYVTRESWTWR